MVPRVYQQVKDFVIASLKYTDELNLSQTEVDDMIRKSTNLLLTRTLSGCLTTLIQKHSVGLLQLIQITINTNYLERTNVYLEDYICSVTGYNFLLSISGLFIFLEILYSQINFLCLVDL